MQHTLPSPSRLPHAAWSQLPSANTFGDLSNFLRGAIADEESRIFSESMQQLAMQGEAVAAGLRLDRHRLRAAPLLMDMLTSLREHHGVVASLGFAWRGLYEYDAYLQALNNFRVLIGQWLLHVSPWDDQVEVTSEEFALVAWRTLGEGTLLIDMYEQWLQQEDRAPAARGPGELQQPQAERALQWWHKLRR